MEEATEEFEMYFGSGHSVRFFFAFTRFFFQEALRRQMNENVKLNCKWLGFVGGLSLRDSHFS